MRAHCVEWMVGVACAAMLTGCAVNPAKPSDPDARAFTGTIIHFDRYTATMYITKDEHHGEDAFPNEIEVKYDAQTKFLLDGRPTTLDHIRQYMYVHAAGHMRQGRMFAETADFSSVLPKNVKATPQGKGAGN